MNVYVESNFVLELALEQEQADSCERLVRLAGAGSIHLVVPAFSLAEPHITLMRKANERTKLSAELQRQLSELERSKPYRDTPGSFSELAAVLIRSADQERAGLQRAVEAMLQSAEVIPLDSEGFHQASVFQVTLDMSMQDSLVLAAIVWHLAKTKPSGSCLLNRNTRDFDVPNVREMLDEFGCKFFGRFDDGVRYVESQLRKAES